MRGKGDYAGVKKNPNVGVFICDTLPHQFHQIFGLADLLGDGRELVVGHKKNF